MDNILALPLPNLNTEHHFSAEALAEQMVIQSLLSFPNCLKDFEVDSNIFYEQAYKIIYKIVMELNKEGSPLDLAYIKVKYKQHFEDQMFYEFFENVWKSRDCLLNKNLKFYVEVLQKRQMKEKFIQIKFRTGHDDLPIPQQVQNLIDDSKALLDQYVPPPEASFSTILSSLIEKTELATQGIKPFSINTHYEALDAALGEGILSDYLVILGGLSGTGKTTFALNVARNIAMYQKHSVMYISLEMDAERVMRWFISACTGVNINAYFRGDFTDREYGLIAHALKTMCDDPLDIQKCSSDLSMILKTIRNGIKNNPNCKLIIIDHLHFITSARYTSPTEIISAATGSFKQLANELGVPIMLLSQLLKPTPEMLSMTPHVGMLKGSGSIISDADLIMILKHNTGQQSDEYTRVIDNYILKNRGGPANGCPIPFMHHAKCARMIG